MALEIERKFLVNSPTWQDAVESREDILQGYLAATDRVTVRVRLKGDCGFLTIKGATSGISRAELEYEIPTEDARFLLDTLVESDRIEKTRHRVPVGSRVWEVDVFRGANSGLVLAEIELPAEHEAIELPDWVGAEVSDDPRYYNSSLARHPFGRW